jgi:hypothetical protein
MMREGLADINQRVPTGYFWRGQSQHLLLTLVLVPGALSLAAPALGDSAWLGLRDEEWVHLLLWAVIAHQVVGWLVFRLQMCFSTFNRLFGDAALVVWGVIFFPFLIARPLLTCAVGWSDSGSLVLIPRSLQVALGLILLLPVGYTLWSIRKYFGVARALGGDHFFAKYRELPLVRDGAFRFSDNAMYSYALLALWSIALLCGSRAALAMALFQHAYIWVHMYCTEDPDLAILYGSPSAVTVQGSPTESLVVSLPYHQSTKPPEKI